jgi:hypothetical protein
MQTVRWRKWSNLLAFYVAFELCTIYWRLIRKCVELFDKNQTFGAEEECYNTMRINAYIYRKLAVLFRLVQHYHF